MDAELKELWEKTLNIIKSELSEVSFNTWIKSCEPISMSSDTIKISVPNAFTQEILEKRYKDLVANSIKAICSKLYTIQFLIASEIQNTEEEIKDKFYYTSFEIGQDATFTTTIDLSKSTKFAKHFYTQQLLRYISPLVDAVKLNFVKDIEVWIKNTQLSKKEYTTYDKYTLKIEYSYLINSLALLIAYDGVSKVATQSINTFNITYPA